MDTAFPLLLQNTQELTGLFAVIDGTEEAANRAFAAARAAAERLDQLSAGYDTKYPEGMAKLTSWFGSKARVADAPVKLPPFDPASARINVEGELAALRDAVGLTHAVAADTLAAFMAETEGLEEEEQEEEQAGEEAVAGSSSSSGSSSGGGGGVGAGPKVALAAGEDDEEEDEDEDD